MINKNLPIELSKEALVIYPSLEVSSEMVMHLTKSDVLSKFLKTRADVKLVARQSKSTRLFLFDSHQGWIIDEFIFHINIQSCLISKSRIFMWKPIS